MEIARKAALFVAISVLAFASMPADASTGPVEEPSAGAMMIDLVVARPIGAAITVLGTATFLVGLPFTALGGNVAESGEKLVVAPARETFNRCLGCKNAGWRGDYAD
ncbi:MAG: hypothetical protein EA417_12450 [Gammaproteobacteria bacterium]|nr:MAG: hypothetical protein EA417_12450 [Gammaproteobacteria bacterium]